MTISRKEIEDVKDRHAQIKKLILGSEIGFTPEDVIDDKIGKLKFPIRDVESSLSKLYMLMVKYTNQLRTGELIITVFK